VINYCPDCGVERYNSSNFCIKCGFNFKEFNIDGSISEKIDLKNSTGEELATSTTNNIEESNDSKTVSESQNLIAKKIEEVSFSHIPYAALSDIKITLKKVYNTTPVHIERDPHDKNTYTIKTADQKSISLYTNTFGVKDPNLVEDLEFKDVPDEHLNDIRSFLNLQFGSLPIHIERDKKADKEYEVKTDQGKVLKLKLGAASIQVIGKNKKRYEIVQEEVTGVGKEYNVLMVVGLIFGVISIFLGADVGFIPLIGIILSIIGLVTFKQEKHEGLWMGIVGLVLNSLFFLVNANMNGHF
jgi:hypothetical protein